MLSIYTSSDATRVFNPNEVNSTLTKIKGLHAYVPLTIPGDIIIDGRAIFDKKVHVEGDLNIIGDLLCKGQLTVNGNLRVGQSVLSNQAIKVSGNLKAGREVEARFWINVGGDISAIGQLKAGGFILAKNILAGREIEAGRFIHAEGDIKAGWWVYSYDFDVKCKRLFSKRLPLGRGFWASLPLLEKWKDEILDMERCWDFWEKLPSSPEKDSIRGDKSLHWTLNGQLSNFLNLTEFITPDFQNKHGQ